MKRKKMMNRANYIDSVQDAVYILLFECYLFKNQLFPINTDKKYEM